MIEGIQVDKVAFQAFFNEAHLTREAIFLSGEGHSNRWSIFESSNIVQNEKRLSIPEDQYLLDLENQLDWLVKTVTSKPMPSEILERFMNLGGQLYSTWKGGLFFIRLEMGQFIDQICPRFESW